MQIYIGVSIKFQHHLYIDDRFRTAFITVWNLENKSESAGRLRAPYIYIYIYIYLYYILIVLTEELKFTLSS